jgi:hypothetical protein
VITPGEYNVKTPQGSTWNFTLTWSIDGIPVNLTGYTARLQLRKRHASPSPDLILTETNGLTLGGSDGTIAVLVDAITTAAIAARLYKYDLELDSGGEVVRLLEGTWDVTPEVTR